jgi:hypothetical protein
VDVLTRKDLEVVLKEGKTPCVSLFLPTHPGGAEQDLIAWKNLLRSAEEGLGARGCDAAGTRGLLAPARAAGEAPSFWRQQGAGRAFFLAPGWSRSYRLPLAVAARAVVARHPHVKPLLPLLSGDGRFFLLALSSNAVRLLEGTRYGAQEVDLHGLPHGLAEALRYHDRDEPLTFHTHPALGLGRKGAIFHGHGVGIDDAKDDLLRYFQAVDHGLHEFLRAERAPLVLAGVEELWPLYWQANTYPHLVEGGAAGCPDRSSPQELHDRAWPLVRPRFEEARQKALALYAQLAGTGRTAADLEEVVAAACKGRLEVLFTTTAPGPCGTVDRATGAVVVRDPARPGDEDLPNWAAVHVLLHGGTVYAVEPGEAPGGGPVAGIYWLPRDKHAKGP